MKRIVITCIFVLVAAFAFAADKPASVTVKGEVIDTYCYVANGQAGEEHSGCGLGCLKHGIPVGLLDGKKLYILLPTKEGGEVPAALKEKVGKSVSVTGHAYAAGGSNFLTVESFK